jgi:mannitol operon repressor
MTDLDDPDALKKARDGVQTLNDSLGQLSTPGLRVFAIASVITGIYTFLADAVNNHQIGSDQAKQVYELLKRFDLFADPPAHFVEMLATFHSKLETSKVTENLDGRYGPIMDELQRFLHSLAFSPPPEVNDPAQIAVDLEDLAEFVSEFKAETDRGAALVGAALIDNRLERLLRSHFIDSEMAEKLLSKTAPLGTFSARIDSCYALGLITEVEYRECVLIRRVRNDFAHELHGLTFASPHIANRCRELKAWAYDLWGSPRQRFMNSVITLCLVLWHRPAHAAPLRAQHRVWPWHLAFGRKKDVGLTG